MVNKKVKTLEKSIFKSYRWCDQQDLNLHVKKTLAPEASASANSAMVADQNNINIKNHRFDGGFNWWGRTDSNHRNRR